MHFYDNMSRGLKFSPFGKIWVHRLLLDVSLIVTCDGSNGLIRPRPVLMEEVGCVDVNEEPALPIISFSPSEKLSSCDA